MRSVLAESSVFAGSLELYFHNGAASRDDERCELLRCIGLVFKLLGESIPTDDGIPWQVDESPEQGRGRLLPQLQRSSH